jgi:hypothetical protein
VKEASPDQEGLLLGSLVISVGDLVVRDPKLRQSISIVHLLLVRGWGSLLAGHGRHVTYMETPSMACTSRQPMDVKRAWRKQPFAHRGCSLKYAKSIKYNRNQADALMEGRPRDMDGSCSSWWNYVGPCGGKKSLLFLNFSSPPPCKPRKPPETRTALQQWGRSGRPESFRMRPMDTSPMA